VYSGYQGDCNIAILVIKFSLMPDLHSLESFFMFMGKHQNSIDAKSRMIIPSKFRDELGLRCVLTKGMDKCLYIYSMQDWAHFMERLAGLPTTDINSRQFMRHFYANANECEIDKQGRIMISQDLREYAGIEKELVTVGVMDKIEVWSKEEWNTAETGAELPPSEMAQRMTEYGI